MTEAVLPFHHEESGLTGSTSTEKMMRKRDYIWCKFRMIFSTVRRHNTQHDRNRITSLAHCIPIPEPLTPLAISGIVPASSTSLPSWEQNAADAAWQSSNSQQHSAKDVDRLGTGGLAHTVYTDILAAVDEALSHIRYAVCGPAALALWARQEKDEGMAPQRTAPQEISIVCCKSTMDVIVSWAVCKGLRLYPGRPDLIGIPAGQDGKIHPLTVNWVDEDTFSQLQIATLTVAPGSYVRVLSLDSLVNVAAYNYAYGESVARDPAIRNTLAHDICWMLRRIASAHDESPSIARLSCQNAPVVLDPIFYLIFVMAHPGAEHLFSKAGIDLPVDAYLEVERSVTQKLVSSTDGPKVPSKNEICPRGSSVRPRLSKSLPPLPLTTRRERESTSALWGERWQKC